ncbi:MAG: hypothetical protein IJ125_01015 [Atopobiaceae bacterium]|nr:hypothetical protein [Atopobiaceae bacterium]
MNTRTSRRTLLGIFLATLLGLAFAVPSLALAEDTPTTAFDNVVITKNVNAESQAQIAGDSFTIKVVELGLENDATQKVRVVDNGSGTYVIEEPSPQIADLTLTVPAGESGNQVLTGTLNPAGDWKHAGVWQYLVYEGGAFSENGSPYVNQQTQEVVGYSTTANQGTIWPMESRTMSVNSNVYVPSQGVYLMRVYVVNDGTGLKVDKVTVDNVVPDVPKGDNADDYGKTSATTPEGKVDPADPATTDPTNAGSDTKGSDFSFTNRFSMKGDLTLKKTVTGDYGDKEKEFSFDVTLVIPEGAETDLTPLEVGDKTVYTVAAHGEADRTFYFGYEKAVGAPITSATTIDKYTATLKGIQLKHGESFVFASSIASGTTNQLPVGTKFIITEHGEAGYQAGAIVTLNKNSSPSVSYLGGLTSSNTTKPNTTVAADLTVQDDTYQVTRNGEEVEIVNFYDTTNVTPTGILINNLPYILLIGIPIAAFLMWFARKHQQVNA